MDKNVPKITVIVPIYKVEPYLRRCIDSVINQTYSNLEIILVNDGSPDNCGKICDEYLQKDSRVKVIHQENQGLSMARNNGMSITTGAYVGFVDSDDYLAPEMYEVMLNHMLKFDLQVVECSIRESGKIFYEQDIDAVFIQDIDEALERSVISGFNSVINKLYSYDLIKDIPFIQGKIYEDILFTSEIWERIDKIGLTPMAFYINPEEGESIQRSAYNHQKIEGLWVINDAVNSLRRLAKKQKSRDVVTKIFMKTLMFHFHSLLENKDLDPKKTNLKKMRRLIKDNSKIKFTTIYFTLINILPLGLYDIFYRINLKRLKLQNKR